jgi:hypothetical protein
VYDRTIPNPDRGIGNKDHAPGQIANKQVLVRSLKLFFVRIHLMKWTNLRDQLFFLFKLMKNLSTLLIITVTWISTPAIGQEMEKVMEKRAREMHRVIGLSEKEQWKKFIQENYTQALIDKPMRVQTTENGETTTSQSKTPDNLEAKASMFQRIHDDFGKSKIISITPGESQAEMVVRIDGGLSATFILKFEKDQPYLIDGLGIEVQDVDR